MIGMSVYTKNASSYALRVDEVSSPERWGWSFVLGWFSWLISGVAGALCVLDAIVVRKSTIPPRAASPETALANKVDA